MRNTPEVRAVDPTTGAKNTYFSQTVATLSKFAFVSCRYGIPEIYVMNADGTNVTRLSTNAAEDLYPGSSPDRSKIAFGSDRDGNLEIHVMNATART